MKTQQSLLTLILTVILTACGGGGGSGGGSPQPAKPAIQGTAAKGIIIGGVVTADELNADGSVKNAGVGSATTASDGSYSLQLNNSYEGGPVQITVSKNTDTTMVCDAPSGCGPAGDASLDTNTNGAVDFGEQYKPSNLSMTALLPDAEDGETINVQVTPYTNMAAERAKSGGTLSAAAITAANSEVSVLLGGVDILRTEPVDITNLTGDEDADAVAYAALSAAILEGAADGSTEPNLEQVLTNLANSFSAGTFQADDLQQIITDTAAALAQVGAIDTSGVLNELQSDVNVAGVGGTIDPEPNANAGDSDVELAKSFIADLRTWGTVIGNELDSPATAFETQLDMAEMAADMAADGSDEAISAGARAIDDHVTGVLTGSDLTGYTTLDGVFTAGTISRVATATGFEYTIANATVNTVAGSVALDMVLIAPEDDTQITTAVFGVTSIIAESAQSRWVVNNGTITAELATPYNLDYDLVNPPNPDVSSVAFNFDVAITQKKTWSNNQLVDASDPVTFTGNLVTTIYPVSDSNGEILDGVPGSMSLGGTISNTTGDSFDMSFTASIPNAASITPLGTVHDLNSSYAGNNGGNHLISWTVGVNTFTYQNPDENYSITFNPADGSVDIVANSIFFPPVNETDPGPYASFAHFVSVYPPFAPNDYTYEKWIPGQGNYVRQGFGALDYSVSGSVTFTLDEVDIEFFDLNNPAIGSVGLQFTAQFDGLPAVDVSLTGNATAFEAGNADLTLTYGTRSLVFDVSNDTADGEVGKVTITNQNGVELILNVDNLEDLDPNNDVQTVTINNKKVADLVELSNGLIKVSYIDGTFEIF